MKPQLRLALISTICVVALGLISQPAAQTPPMSPKEQADLDVVKTWIGAWGAKDPELAASTMAEDVFWAGAYPDDPPGGGVSRGRARFRAENSAPILTGINFEIEDVVAIGGSAGTAVLLRRADEFGAGWFTNAVLFWVKDGKIQVWYDIPAFFPPVPRAQAPPLDTWAPQERAAIDLVTRWFGAWSAGDPNSVASSMADEVLFSTDYPLSITEKGRAHFLVRQRGNIARRVNMRITQSLAVGGTLGTAVLARRVDRVTVGGQPREVPSAAFFWVVNGTIHTWLDFPLETSPTGATGALVR